jgi:hypothetical protein
MTLTLGDPIYQHEIDAFLEDWAPTLSLDVTKAWLRRSHAFVLPCDCGDCVGFAVCAIEPLDPVTGVKRGFVRFWHCQDAMRNSAFGLSLLAGLDCH